MHQKTYSFHPQKTPQNRAFSGMVSIRSATDYSPFGVQLENRNFLKSGLGEDYRMGFQGQEEDDEVKGEGNSVNYTFRMHDPRLGRFFSLDPLALEYPHNSPYSFSENNVIAYVELEGMEKFYAASGKFIGQIGDDPTIRIFSEKNVKEGSKWVAWANGTREVGRETAAVYNSKQAMTISFGFENMKTLNQTEIDAYGNVLDAIYEDVANLSSIKSGEIGIVDCYGTIIRGEKNIDSETAARNTSGKAFTMINEKAIYVLQSSLSSNYYEMALTLFHEGRHLTGHTKYSGTAFGEFNAHYSTTQHEFYKKASQDWKVKNLEKMEDYLGKQEIWLKTSETMSRDDYDSWKGKFLENKKLYEKEYNKIHDDK